MRAGTRWGFILPDGAFSISPQFDWAMPFRNGLARVGISGYWAYINQEGTVIWQEKP
ncbi:MAG: WG repeat-containing protein [Haliscomenobacter sp.]|nr:WG repeat-containing protein [Haliscomenobacter sp.]